MTDNAMIYRQSTQFARLLDELGAHHIRTPPYTPRWNGKVERFIQTLDTNGPTAASGPTSTQRDRGLASWLRFYNRRRPTQLTRRPATRQPRSPSPWAGQLIWPDRLSSPQHRKPRVSGAFLLVWEAAGGGLGATRGQADMRGLATAGPGFRLRARRLAPGVTAGAAAHSCLTDALARRARGARRLLRPTCARPGSVGGGDRPAEAGQLARGGDRDDRAALAALLHPRPDAMQPALRLP